MLHQAARERNPRRWSRQTRDWTPVGAVTLNPERKAVVEAALSDTRLSRSTGEPAFPRVMAGLPTLRTLG